MDVVGTHTDEACRLLRIEAGDEPMPLPTYCTPTPQPRSISLQPLTTMTPIVLYAPCGVSPSASEGTAAPASGTQSRNLSTGINASLSGAAPRGGSRSTGYANVTHSGSLGDHPIVRATAALKHKHWQDSELLRATPSAVTPTPAKKPRRVVPKYPMYICSKCGEYKRGHVCPYA